MAKTKISEFSATPGNNTDIDSINIAEGCAPSGINDAIRELMSQLKDFQTGAVGDSFNGPVGTTTAAAGAFTTLTTSSTVTHNGGTANGVTYLNGSKVLTSGSALTFDGATLTNTAGGVVANGAVTVTGVVNASKTLYLSNYADAAANWNYIRSSNGVFDIVATGSNSLAFAASGSEQMRLTSTGLGIGTSSPGYKLDVQNASGAAGISNKGTTGANYFGWYNSTLITQIQSASTRTFINSVANVPLVFGTNDTIRATLDTSGNLGLGVTPSAWSTFKVLELTGGVHMGNYTGSNNAFFGANSYFNGSAWVYKATANAARYQINGYDGSHAWLTAPSGTAGAAISFTQAMTLDASGNLLVGQTSVYAACDGKLSVTKSGASTASPTISVINADASAAFVAFSDSASVFGSITRSGSSASYNTSSDYRLKNITGPITTSGAYIDSLNPVEGTWKADGSTFVGLIAHEAQEVSRTQVATGTKDGEEMQGMSYSSSEMIANMIAELKALRARVAALEAV